MIIIPRDGAQHSRTRNVNGRTKKQLNTNDVNKFKFHAVRGQKTKHWITFKKYPIFIIHLDKIRLKI